VRSAVLGGVSPPQADRQAEFADNGRDAIARFFAACGTDPDCGPSDPEAAWLTRVDELDRTPFETTVTRLDGRAVNVRLDGGFVARYLFGGLYETAAISSLAWILRDEDLQSGLQVAAEAVAEQPAMLRGFSDGLFLSVMCREDFDPGLEPAPVEASDPLRSLHGVVLAERAACEAWDVGFAPGTRQPVSSDVPVLLISGEFDPITPPHYAALAAETLSRSYHVELAGAGHDAAVLRCGQKLVRSFVSDPSSAPSDECIDKQRAPDF
jgi:pimeloyl-ACP methyl ester carboxylesterase